MVPVPEMAYLISSDTVPAQVTRLAAVLRSGSSGAVIGVAQDAGAGSLDLRRMHELDVDLLETTSVARGSADELLRVLRCLRRLLESRFDWLVLISGSDYPIRPVAEIEASLAGAATDGFIETHFCEPPAIRRAAPVDQHALRYHYRWSSRRRSRPLGRALAAALSPHVAAEVTPTGVRIGVPAKRSPFKQPRGKLLTTPIRHNPLSPLQAERSPFGEGLECRYGPASFVLSRRAVEVVDTAVREHPELVLYYRDTLVPVESYIHTVLTNDSSISLQASRRFELAGAVADVDAVLASHADFAGPLHLGSDVAVLDAIDARVHYA